MIGREYDEKEWESLWKCARDNPQHLSQILRLGDQMAAYQHAVWNSRRGRRVEVPERISVEVGLGRILDPGCLFSRTLPGSPAGGDGWFSGSKIVDDTGSPISLFHSHPRSGVDSHEGPVYMSYDESSHNENKGDRVLTRVHASIKNPMILDSPQKVKSAWERSGALSVPGMFYPHKQGALNAWAKSIGHDGIVVHPSAFEGDEGWHESSSTWGEPQVVAFSKSQVRPATGKWGTI